MGVAEQRGGKRKHSEIYTEMNRVKKSVYSLDKMDDLRGPPLPIIERYYHKYYAIGM